MGVTDLCGQAKISAWVLFDTEDKAALAYNAEHGLKRTRLNDVPRLVA